MLPRISFFTILLLVLTGFTFAQDGKLAGKVTDESGQPLEFVTVVVFEGELSRYGTQTRSDGSYSIQPVSPGTYRVEARYLGASKSITNVTVVANQTKRVDISFSVDKTLDEVVIEEESPFDNSPIVGTTLTNEQIINAGTRNVQSLAALSAGVYQNDDGGDLSIRGARTTSTVYYIDGVKVRGQTSLPQSSISQLQVITGGTPAEFGDFTGGVISITTAGPSSRFSGGGELVTSEFLDPYGRNLAALTLSGPLIKRKRYLEGTDTEFETSVLGFFVNAEYDYERDQDPAALGVYQLRDGLLDSLERNPLVIAEDQLTFRSRGNFVTADDVEQIATKPRNESTRIRALARLDFQPADNILIKVGGNAEWINRDIWDLRNMLFNPQANNRVFQGNYYRGWARFQQSFPGTKGAAIRNLFYSLQADYSVYTRNFFNEAHGDNLFDYGYIGRFDFDITPLYNYVNDPNSPVSSSPYWRTVGYLATDLTFDPSDTRNPLLANYNTSIFDYAAENGIANLFGFPTFEPTINAPINPVDLAFRQGLLNGQRPGQIYSLFRGIGRDEAAVQRFKFEQFRLSGQATAEIKGHNLKAGFEFEQRNERFYGINANGLWSLMRQYANFHLASLQDDPSTFIYERNSGGEWNDTVTVPLQYVANDQRNFDIRMREALGLSIDGTDLINTDAYGPEFYNMDFFTADELLQDGLGIVNYYGYDYQGNEDRTLYGDYAFFDDTTRPINPFRPTYISAFLQDKFEFEDIIFNIGVRVDRFDANQPVLRDPYSLYPTISAGELANLPTDNIESFGLPAGIGEDFVPYVNDAENPTAVIGYRNGEVWYDANGTPVSSATIAQRSSEGRPQPAISADSINQASFEDYTPQTVVMPRISFSFPISDVAQFFAHYDVLAQRPGQLLPFQSSLLAAQISDYVFLENRPTTAINNPNLKPEVTVEYEAGFKQRLGARMALTISAYYREMRNMVRFRRFANAYPFSYDTYDNLDFGTAKGFAFSFSMLRTNNVSLQASYTLQFSDGTGSSFNDARNVTRFLEGVGVLRVPLPNGNDQRHRIAGNLDYRFARNNGPALNLGDKTIYPLKNAGANLSFYLGSGFPYTRNAVPVPSVQSGINIVNQVQGTVRGSRLPWQFRLDLRVDKSFTLGGKTKKDGTTSRGYDMQVYLTLLNALDTRNVISVYRYTGLPDDDGYLTSDLGQQSILTQIDPQAYVDQYTLRLRNPDNYSLPRRIRLGLLFNF